MTIRISPTEVQHDVTNPDIWHAFKYHDLDQNGDVDDEENYRNETFLHTVIIPRCKSLLLHYDRGNGCNMLTRLPSVSWIEIQKPTPGIIIGSIRVPPCSSIAPRIVPPLACTASIAA